MKARSAMNVISPRALAPAGHPLPRDGEGHPQHHGWARWLAGFLLAAGTPISTQADGLDFEDLVAGAPGGAGGPSVVLSNQYVSQGVLFENTQGFDYAYSTHPYGFTHSGTKAVAPWANAWSEWTPLGGFLLQAGVGMGGNQADARECFVLGGDGTIYGGWRVTNAGVASLEWEGLQAPTGVQFLTVPVVARNADGRREVFGLGNDGSFYHKFETSLGGPWSTWYSLGGWQMQGPIAAATNADGRLEVYVRGSDHNLWSCMQNAPNCCWSDWLGVGDRPLAVKTFSVNANSDGRLEIIAVGEDGSLYDLYQGAPGEAWSPWLSLGGWNLPGPLALGRNADGRLEGFVVGGDGVVYRKAQSTSGVGSWTDWSSMSHPSLSTVTDLAVNALKDGRLFLLLRQADGTLFYRAQVAPNGGWGGPISLGGTHLQWPVTLARDPDGRLELWAIGQDGQVYNRAMGGLNPAGGGYLNPITLRFTRPLREVTVWAGYWASPGSDRWVVLRGYDEQGYQVTATTGLAGPTVNTPLTLTAYGGHLVQATVGYLAAESGLEVNDDLTIDDVQTTAADQTPFLTMDGVWSGIVYLVYHGPPNQAFTLLGSEDLSSWFPVGQFTASSSLHGITDNPPPDRPRRFYRLGLPATHYAPGQNMLVLQGLWHHTLVAGKTTALRLFTGPVPLESITRVETHFLRPDGSQRARTHTAGATPSFVLIPQSSLGPSVVVTIPGSDLPMVGEYDFSVQLYNSSGQPLAWYESARTQLLPTKDLRVGVDRVWSNTGTVDKPGEIAAAHAAMQRLAAVFPVRDGLSSLDGDRTAGLRYLVNDHPIGPPNQDSQICPFLASWLNRPAGVDSIDAAITYRFPDSGEGCGGNANHNCAGQPLVWSVSVWHEPLAYVFAHETGHTFGLEPAAGPNWDGGVHSRNATLDRQELDLGFNVQYRVPFAATTLDLMYGLSSCPGPDPALVSFSTSDWEYLRQTLVSRLTNSTGPANPGLQWQSLGGAPLQPPPAVGFNADGRREAFVLDATGALLHKWETSPGGSWNDWHSLGGWQLQLPVVVATNADGRLEAYVRGSDNYIYYLNQVAPNGGWSGWSTLVYGATPFRSFAVCPNSDGRIEMVAVGVDGTLYDNVQGAPNQAWGAWMILGGTALQAPVALTRNADGRLEVFALGGDGVVYTRWQTTPGQGSWSDWLNMAHSPVSAVTNLGAATRGDGTIALLVRQADGALYYYSQGEPNGGFQPPLPLGGANLQWPVSLARTADGRLELWAVGLDGHLYIRWQVAVGRPDAWSDWTALGGSNLQPGPALLSDPTSQLEVFVVGGDGALWRGWR